MFLKSCANIFRKMVKARSPIDSGASSVVRSRDYPTGHFSIAVGHRGFERHFTLFSIFIKIFRIVRLRNYFNYVTFSS